MRRDRTGEVVVVTWDDAREGRGTPEAHLDRRRTVGWVIRDDAHVLVLAHCTSTEDEDTYYSVIPQVAVQSVLELREDLPTITVSTG